MFQKLQTALRERLLVSSHPVERDIADLLSGLSVPHENTSFRLQRYQRKIDVAHRVMAAYDERIDKAMSTQTISSEGYLGLALVFMQAALREPGCDEASRANTLRWVNSAFNCLDHTKLVSDMFALGDVNVELQALVRKGIAS